MPANIAEGNGRGSLGEYTRFLDNAKGSLSELEYLIHFLGKEGLIPPEIEAELSRRQSETGRVLQGLWTALKHKERRDWNHSGVHNEKADYSVSPPDSRFPVPGSLGLHEDRIEVD